MKKHRAELRTLVLAMVVSESSVAKRMAFKTFGVAFVEVWGFPLRLATSHDEAMKIAWELLLERVGSATV